MADNLITSGSVGAPWAVPNGLAEFFINGGGLNIDYFMAVRVNGQKKAVVPLPEQPNSVEVLDEFYEMPIYTFREDYAYREIAKPRRRKIKLMGQVGTKRRLNMKATSGSLVGAELTNVTGEENLRNFEAFLRDYHTLASGSFSPAVYSIDQMSNDLNYHAGKPFLEIKCFPEKISGRCVVDNFSYSRNVSSKRLGGYNWVLELTIYDDTKMESPLSFTPFEELAKGMADAIAGAEAFLQIANGIADGVIAETSGAISTVTGAVKSLARAAEQLATAPLRVLSAIDNIVADLLDTVTALDAAASNIINAYANGFNEPGFIFGSTANSWNSSDWLMRNEMPMKKNINTAAEPDPVVETGTMSLQAVVLIDAIRAMDNLLAMLGVYRTLSARAGFQTDTGFLQTERGLQLIASLQSDLEASLAQSSEQDYSGPTRPYVLASGENLMTIATSLLGTPEEWFTLAEINRCPDAYTLRDGSPMVAGSVIRVPIQSAVLMHNLGQPLLSSTEQYTQDEYGTDLYLDPFTGDLQFLDRDDGSETTLVTDLDNLTQAIMIMIRTAVGAVTADPVFGSAAQFAIGVKFTERVAVLLAANIEEVLLSDPRIESINNFVAVPNYAKGSLEISMNVVTYLGDTVSVNVPV